MNGNLPHCRHVVMPLTRIAIVTICRCDSASAPIARAIINGTMTSPANIDSVCCNAATTCRLLLSPCPHDK